MLPVAVLITRVSGRPCAIGGKNCDTFVLLLVIMIIITVIIRIIIRVITTW